MYDDPRCSLFIRCNGVIFCSKTSVCRCNFHSLIKNFAIVFQQTITALIQYLLIEAFAAKFHIVRRFVVAAKSFTTKTQHFRTPEHPFEKTKFSRTGFKTLMKRIRCLYNRNRSSVRGDKSINKGPYGTDVASRYQSTTSDRRPNCALAY